MRVIFLVLLFAAFLYPGDEQQLLRILRVSRTPEQRQTALLELYRHYKKERLDAPAQAYLEKLIRIQTLRGDRVGLQNSHLEQARRHRDRKNYPAALDHYFETLKYAGNPESNSGGIAYLEIAEIFRTMNHRGLAARYLDRAMAHAERRHKPCLEIRALNAYSSLAYETGDYDAALQYINRSLETEEKQKQYVCGADSLYKKALILGKANRPGGSGRQEAVTLLKTAVDRGLEMKQYETLLPVMNAYVRQLIRDGELAEAARYLDMIDDLYAPFYPHYFFYYYLNARLSEKMNRREEALAFYRRTADALPGKTNNAGGVLTGQTDEIYSRMIAFYLDMHRRSSKEQYLRQALYFAEIKNAYIHQLTAGNTKKYRRLMNEKKKLENEYTSTLHRFNRLMKGPAPDPERADWYRRKLAALKTQTDELAEFVMEIPLNIKPYHVEDFNVPSIRRQLGPNRLVLKYALLEKDVFLFYMNRTSVGRLKLKITATQLEKLVRRLTEPLDDFTRGRADYLRIHYDIPTAHRLYRVLLEPLLTKHPGAKELVIIPDRQLFKLPFEALVTGYNREMPDPGIVFSEYAAADYLIQKHTVSYLMSLFHLRETPGRRDGKPFTIAAFGAPVINNTETQTGGVNKQDWFRELPSARREVAIIQNLFGKTAGRGFTGAGFNRANFERYAPRARVVHIATHFINNLQYPRYSALLFSAESPAAPADYYHAHEIFNLRLDSDLVVLSACESAENHLQGFQAMRGMTASFRHAGARAMMVGMWPVDEHSSRLIPFFYRRYRDGETQAAALRAAKLKLMKQTGEFDNGVKIAYAHPFIWANYVLYGF